MFVRNISPLVGGVILGLAAEEEHQDDGNEGGDQRDDEECRCLESGELLLGG